MIKPCQNDNDVRTLHAKLMEASNTQSDLERFLEHVKQKLKGVQWDIVSGKMEDEERVFYALVNTNADAIAKMATTLNATEIAFFKKLISEAVRVGRERRSLLYMNALNFRSSVVSDEASSSQASASKLNLDQVERCMKLLEREGWIVVTEDERVEVGMRTHLELRDYLAEVGAAECAICGSYCTKPLSCSECDTKVHRRCLRNWSNHNGNKCPTDACPAPWDDQRGAPSVAPADQGSQPAPSPDESQSQSQRKRKARR